MKTIDLKFGPENLDKLWKLPTKINSVEMVNVLQFLTPVERIRLMNDLYKNLVPGGKIVTQTPHWASARAYGDLAFHWPPIVPLWFHHLNAEWRKVNNPREKRYKCNFQQPNFGVIWHPSLVNRNSEFQQDAALFKTEAVQDLIVHLVK